MSIGKLSPLILILGVAPSASAQTSIPLTVSGNEATGRIELPAGISADLSISFEQVVGLNPAALDVSASMVDSGDGSIRSRLKNLSNPTVAFPVLLRIEASESSALTFSGVVSVSLHTSNLQLDPSSPLSLFSAPRGGTFRDITTAVGMGSYRASGTGGGFSDFMIVADTRSLDTIIGSKFDRIQADITGNADSMPLAVSDDLQARLARGRDLWQAGQTAAAISEMTAFSDFVKSQSGATIPDVWRAHDTRVNVAGVLRAGAETLKYSLNLKANRSP